MVDPLCHSEISYTMVVNGPRYAGPHFFKKKRGPASRGPDYYLYFSGKHDITPQYLWVSDSTPTSSPAYPKLEGIDIQRIGLLGAS